LVVGSKRHAGAEHLIIRQPDRTLALLPTWMAVPGQTTAHEIVPQPRLKVERLLDLRALVDALMASCQGDSPRCEGLAMASTRHRQGDLFEPAARVADLRPDLRTKLTPLLQTLLTEAAGVEPRSTTWDDRNREEGGDDQDHG
jgi:hypothetical protein